MKSLLEKRIPTAVGLILLVVTVLATSYLTHTGVILFNNAAPTDNPQNVRITNISDTSFTVTYTTQAQVIGTLALTLPDGTTQTILDERDQKSGTPQLYQTHSIRITHLVPTTTYAFSISSGTTVYQNNGSPFNATTGPTVSGNPSDTKPLSGKLLGVHGTAPTEALIFLTTKGSTTLSTLINPDGTYILPLNNFFSSDLSKRLVLDDTSLLQVLATDGTNTSQIQTRLSNASPLPLITLGNSYNFLTSTQPIASTAATLGFPVFPQDTTLTATPVITVPKKDQSFTDAQPQFSGTALPNQTVTVVIHSSSAITATVTTDGAGNWTYRPISPLSPGQHILLITAKNAAGILQTIQQSFTVYASGTQVSQTATPSATLNPTTTPLPIVSATPTILPTATPLPTLFPTGKPTTQPTLPPTGSNALITTSLLGLVTTLIGGVLFVLTKGAAL